MVLHLLLAHLKPGTTDERREQLMAAFSDLLAIPEALRLGCVVARDQDSTHDLALFACLTDAAALERFGTDARYMRYLRGSFLPLVERFVTVDLRLDDRPLPGGHESALCFCLDVPPATYDWQVRAVLSRLTEESRAEDPACLGIALNDRQPYRAGGVICASQEGLDALTKALVEVAESEAVTDRVSVAGRLTVWERA
jgi:hypothetical protein